MPSRSCFVAAFETQETTTTRPLQAPFGVAPWHSFGTELLADRDIEGFAQLRVLIGERPHEQ